MWGETYYLDATDADVCTLGTHWGGFNLSTGCSPFRRHLIGLHLRANRPLFQYGRQDASSGRRRRRRPSMPGRKQCASLTSTFEMQLSFRRLIPQPQKRLPRPTNDVCRPYSAFEVPLCGRIRRQVDLLASQTAASKNGCYFHNKIT